MKKLSIFIVLMMCALPLAAQPEWQNAKVNQINRAPMHTNYFAYESREQAERGCKELSERFLSLGGEWRFHFAPEVAKRPAGFFAVGYDDAAWGQIEVPGLFELQGYGHPLYVNMGYAWLNQFRSNPPHLPVEGNYVGSYRREIEVPASWRGEQIMAHFGAVSSNIYLWVNGKFVGYSEDSKLEAEFDLTPYLHTGRNLIAFQVFRWCDGSYLEDQDFLRLTGVARDCYLYARAKAHIRDVRFKTLLDAQYRDAQVVVDLDLTPASKGCDAVATLHDPEGREVASKRVRSTGRQSQITFDVAQASLWSAEIPNLYRLDVALESQGRVLEVIPLRVGIRSTEVRNGQLLVNGRPILIKGVDRHEMDPRTGYYVSRERMESDIKVLKSLNINAVRTCHYPDANEWYDLCDRYGIYVVAEANVESHGMGYDERTLAKNPDFLLPHLERNERHVQRTRNHCCVIVWSMGNEAGDGENFVAAYNMLKKLDTTRPVQYERAGKSAHNDIYCPMYLDYDECETYLKSNPDKPLIQCEYAHAMGNSMGGFKEYWELIRKYPQYQGGFIWDFADQGLLQKNDDGLWVYKYGGDWSRYDASDNNFMNNGVVSPERGFNPHAYEVRYFHQNIWTSLVDSAPVVVELYNENFFKNIDDTYLCWQLVADGEAVRSGVVAAIDVAPQTKGRYALDCDLAGIDPKAELYLNVEYRLKRPCQPLPADFTIARQQLPVRLAPGRTLPEIVAAASTSASANVVAVDTTDRHYLRLKAGSVALDFDRANGFISTYAVRGCNLMTADGALRPNFWRAPIDNDFGAGLQSKYRVWREPKLTLISLDVAPAEGGAAVVCARYTMPDVAGRLTITYHVYASGVIAVEQALVADKSMQVADMFRFGMQMTLVRDMDSIEYYGRGPYENYADRHDASFVGHYRQSVAEQYYPYIRPQETGNKTDLRQYTLHHRNGLALRVESPELFEATALHYRTQRLDDGEQKHQRHGLEIAAEPLTTLSIDKRQMGLGCINSWGELPIEKYRMPYGDYTFEFVIIPNK